MDINIQVIEPELKPQLEPEPRDFSGEAIDTCSIVGRRYQVLADLQGREEAIIIVEDDKEEVKENVNKRGKRPGGPMAPPTSLGLSIKDHLCPGSHAILLTWSLVYNKSPATITI